MRVGLLLSAIPSFGRAAPPPQIEFVGSAVASNAGATSLTIDFSSTSPQEGDLVVINGILLDSTDRVLSGPVGWTKVWDYLTSDTYKANYGVFYKLLAPGDPNTFEFTWGGTSEPVALTAYVLRNVDQVNPLDATTTVAGAANSRIINPPSITTVTEGAMVLAMGATRLSGTLSAPYLTDFVPNSVSTAYMGIGHVKPPVGAYDPDPFTVVSEAADSGWGGATMAIRPAS